MRALLLALLLVLGTLPSFAVDPDEILADPALEARARAISADLRCLVCQNQSIDDSDADLARDLRVIVRERLEAGDSDAEVVQYVVDRYGEYVLLNPVVAPHTIVLWLAAPALLLIGGAVVVMGARRRSRQGQSVEPVGLSDAETRALEALEARPSRGPADPP